MPIRPTNNDVLLGRGGNYWAHKGNERLRDFALRRTRQYAAAKKKEKAVISREVLRQVKGAGGRFLRCADYKAEEWKEVCDVTAREKVCQVLRDHVSAISRDINTQESDRSSSSEDIEAEEEEEDSGADATCHHIRGGGEWEALPGLPQVEDEAVGFYQSDALATDDLPMPMPNLITSSVVSPTSRERTESTRDNFEVGADYNFASYCGDFDLFEGDLLRSSAYDEIFVTPPPKNVMQL